MVLVAVVVSISMTSGHFEWVSIMTRKFLHRNGPAKSMLSRCQGRAGYSHGWSGGVFPSRHCWHEVARIWMSSSSPGQHAWLLATNFILTTPGCLLCKSWRMRGWSFLGITTRIPHIRQSPSVESSSLHLTYGFSSSCTLIGHPVLAYRNTRLNTWSDHVAAFTWDIVTSRESSWAMLNTVASGTRSSETCWGLECMGGKKGNLHYHVPVSVWIRCRTDMQTEVYSAQTEVVASNFL